MATAAGVAASLATAGWVGVAATALVGIAVLLVNPWLVGAPRRFRIVARGAVAAALLLPPAAAAVTWGKGGAAVPLELPLIAACRNALFGLAATAECLRQWQRVVALSLFVVLLASLRLSPVMAFPVLVTYAMLGCGWLAVSQGTSPAARSRGTFVAATFVVIGGTVLGAVATSGTSVGLTLRGWLPSSGGSGAGSDLAASGLGNGPDEVPGADHARSAGFDQSQTFMNSENPGLYDAFLETAGEPLKKGSFEKLQMLRAKQLHWTASSGIEDYRGGRRFSLDRRPPAPPTAAASSHAATALLYVDGPLPVHLRTAAYDTFDGATWTEARGGWSGHDLHDATAADPWFGVGGTGGRSYRVRVGTLVSDTLPLPPLTTRFHLGRVVTARLLGWKASDVLCMRRAAVPPGTVLDADCAPFDAARYPVDDWLDDLSAQRAAPVVDPRIVRLARQWTDGLPRGWSQVQAVIAGIRSRCTLDQAYRPAEAAALDRLAEFLFDAHRGPDYLFASSAAVMLGQLGYTSRMAGGFYVTTVDQDPKAEQSFVTSRCAHSWAEVRLPGGRWAVVEATPGYTVLGPDQPWMARATAALRAHALSVGVCSTAVLATLLGRLWLLDVASAAVARAWPGRTWAVQARRTLRLVELRARWAGHRRPATVTPRQWLRSTVPGDATVGRFADVVTWAAYGPLAGPPWSPAEVRATCRAVTGRLTASRMRRQGGQSR